MKDDLFYALGVDTSNYTTSIAVVDNTYQVVADERLLLEVPQGARGLRQSDAVFKHMTNLPILMEKVFSKINSSLIRCISVSNRPRPVENSYMPVFLCGQAFSKCMSITLNTDFFEFTHQEGHVKAGCLNDEINGISNVIVLHISGGTSEVLEVDEHDDGYHIKIIGGTKDISMGQLIDRVGVKLGYAFPSGRYLDTLACEINDSKTELLKKIYIDKGYMNLSGIETQCYHLIESHIEAQFVVKALFERITNALAEMIDYSVSASGINHVLLVGGVASSVFIKERLKDYLKHKDIQLHFAKPQYSTDNAVGIAALGIDKLVRG